MSLNEARLSCKFRIRDKATGEYLRYWHRSSSINFNAAYLFSNQDEDPIFEVDSWVTAFVALHYSPSTYNTRPENPLHLVSNMENYYEVAVYQSQSQSQAKTVHSGIRLLNFQEHFEHATTYKRTTVLVVKKTSDLQIGDIVYRSYNPERIQNVIPMPIDMRGGFSGNEREGMRIAYLETVPDTFVPAIEVIPVSSFSELQQEANDLKADGREIIERLGRIEAFTDSLSDRSKAEAAITETLQAIDDQYFNWRIEIESYAAQVLRAIKNEES